MFGVFPFEEENMSRRTKMTEEILQMMANPAQIRNIGLVGHIDHGKTTLSDSLLAEARLLSESLAGEARVLDYLAEEQRRGITMKSTNVSLYYEHSLKGSQPFLINLVDTPGHLDFSGKVTRALRLIDGVVVIVDSVEEISSQTETVVRQSLEEAARPILFINKIDRLFRELKLDADQIKAKFARIIQEFNNLIEAYGNEKAKAEWKVSAEKGTVIFGSALHRWGFVIPQLVKNGHNFEYFAEVYEEESYKSLKNTYPVWEATLAAVVQYLPNPQVAQKYRTQAIWSGDINTEVGKAIRACDPNGPVVICLSKVQLLKNRLIGTGRIFSGTLRKGDLVWLVDQEDKSPVNQLSIFMGSRMESISEIPAGNIAAIGGIKKIRSGETLFALDHKDDASSFESVKYVSEPVVTVAVEPDMLKNLSKLEEVLKAIQIEDPNISMEISSETGECLLSGMGPLHLEIIADTVKARGVNISVSKPTSVFRESIAASSQAHMATSPNGLNNVTLRIERLDAASVEYLRGARTGMLENEFMRSKELPEHTSLSVDEAKGLQNVDRFQNVIIFQPGEEGGMVYSEDLKKAVVKATRELCRFGSLAREPLSELKITLETIKMVPDREESNYFEISTMLQDTIHKCLREAGPVLLEPIYGLIINSPEEHIGTVSSLLNQFQGKILDITQDSYRSFIKARMSVRQTIEFSTEVRGATSGRVFWQTLFEGYQPVPEQQRDEIIQNIKFRKGLVFM